MKKVPADGGAQAMPPHLPGKSGDDMAKALNKKESKRNKRKRRNGVFMITAVVLTLCFILTYNSFGMKASLKEKEAQIEELQAQVDEQQQRQEELVKESEYIKSDDYIEEVARDKLGLVHDNEIVFKKQDEKN